jgi:hypothetical protein
MELKIKINKQVERGDFPLWVLQKGKKTERGSKKNLAPPFEEPRKALRLLPQAEPYPPCGKEP